MTVKCDGELGLFFLFFLARKKKSSDPQTMNRLILAFVLIIFLKHVVVS